MDFICYLHPGWAPLIRPAEATRPWMDATPEAFAYRCLPLNIANAHGWEILCPCDATATWTGGAEVRDVVVRTEARGADAPVSLFGQGVLTFHIQALFRTPPGWDLWVGGSPNLPKPGLWPLTGIVETDWSPYSFTMNWRFTRRNHRVRFVRGEPICFVFPVQRHALERFVPKTVRLADTDDLARQFAAWSRSRDAFHATMADGKVRAPSEKWQKRYYRGIDMHDATAPGHRTRMRLAPFTEAAPLTPEPAAPASSAPASSAPEPALEPAGPALDEAWLAGLLAEVVRRAEEGRDAVAGALAAAGLPEATAQRLADVVAGAGTAR